MKAKKLLEMPIFRVYFIPKMQLFLFMCFTRASAKKLKIRGKAQINSKRKLFAESDKWL